MQAILDFQSKRLLIPLGIIISLFIAISTVKSGLIVPILTMVVCSGILLLILIFKQPFTGLIITIGYCFVFGFIARESGLNLPFGYVEFLYILVWIAIIFRTEKSDWVRVCNDLSLIFSIWFVISVLQLFNPADPDSRGWVHEIRSSGLDSFLLVPAGFLLFRNTRHLDIFIIVIIACSLLATINAFTQTHIGLTSGEEAFIAMNPTHMIWGKLRAFAFYRDAGQFGASQAQLAVICGILAIGPFKLWQRLLLLCLAFVFFYGMLLSGTRGALFALVPGLFLAVILFKNMKVLFLGTIFTLVFLAFLKFTHIGNSNYNIMRLRSALSPEDASLNVRLESQLILRDYLEDKPFGEGLGVIGYAGREYNADKFLSTIEPDSYWVKIWAMYGIVGFIIWFCMMSYILGKCCGIIWKIKNEKLRVKLIALTAGFCGILICSYGNEVINALPSSIVTYLSLVFVFLGPRFEKALASEHKQIP